MMILPQTITYYLKWIIHYSKTEGQNCSTQHIESCTTAYYSTLIESAGDIGAICSVINTYTECMQTLSDCNSTAVHEAISDANTTLYQSGCEIESQNCSTKQITSCTTAYGDAIPESPRTKEAICSVIDTYMECLLTYSSHCNSNAVHEAIANANTSLYQFGCAQNCSTKQITSCTTSLADATRESPRTKEAICSLIRTYIECLQTYSSDCNSNAVHAAIANANTSLYQSGCENEAHNCSTSQIGSCATAYSNALRDSPRTKEAICSVLTLHLDCLERHFSDCNLEAGQQAIDGVKMSLTLLDCDISDRPNSTSSDHLTSTLSAEVNGAGSIIFTFFVMCFGLTLYKLV
ncbi:Hypothetical predicted protein [Mytilus galloprovincialis]|nr:Hypothetical predicted protein [Mytilus galloprovincialis]